jgi:hypothetical protein
MTDNRSVNFGRDGIGNVIVTGNRNQVDAKISTKLVRTTLPSPDAVNLSKELVQIRAILERIGGEHTGKIGDALDDAAAEATKPQPDKNAVGSALSRALDYAQKGAGFATEVTKLAPHIANAVAWLGSNWHRLLPAVGLVV